MSLLSLVVLALDSPARDGLVAPPWLLANVLLFAAAWKWVRRLFPQDSYLELTGHAIVLCWASIVVVATGLGAIGYLSGFALLLSIGALSLVALALDHGQLLGPRPGPVPLDRADMCWLSLWAALFSNCIGHIVTKGLWEFPSDWDSLAYHIPLVDHWLQAGSLYTAGCARWANPGNNELLALWAVGPFSGDFLVSLNNLPAAILLACSAVAFARQIGLPRPLAHLAGLALVCHSVVLQQLVDGRNDVAVAACFFAALAYSFRHAAVSGGGALMLGAISLGLLAGVKYYALGYAALAFVVWVLFAAMARGRHASIRVLLAGTTGFIAFGSYWYLRNWLVTGSPLYPKELFQYPDLLSQIYPDVAHTSFFGNGDPALLELYIKAIWLRTGPCLVAAFLLVPLSISWLLGSAGWYAFRAVELAPARMNLALAILLVGAGMLLGMTPLAVEDSQGTLNQLHKGYTPVRYGLCFLSTATMAALLLLRDLFFRQQRPAPADREPHPWRHCCSIGLRFLVCLILAVALLYQLERAGNRLASDWLNNLLIASNILLGGLILVLLKVLWSRLRPGLVLLVPVLLIWAWACALLADRWHRGFIPHYATMFGFTGFEELEKKDPGPHTILVLEPRCYPFFGSRRQHRVCQPVYIPSPEWLMEFIRKENITFVVANSWVPSMATSIGMRRFLGFDECRTRHPDTFSALTVNGVDTLVEVLQPSEQSTRTTENKE